MTREYLAVGVLAEALAEEVGEVLDADLFLVRALDSVGAEDGLDLLVVDNVVVRAAWISLIVSVRSSSVSNCRKSSLASLRSFADVMTVSASSTGRLITCAFFSYLAAPDLAPLSGESDRFCDRMVCSAEI
jgi:hypothetical protein